LIRLTPEAYQQGIEELSEREPVFAGILQAYGPPPLWDREPGFPTLVKIILEQQVSLASAAAAFRKLHELVSPLTPQSFLTLNDVELKAAGFSRQKTAYSRTLAQAILDGSLDLEALAQMDRAEVHAALTRVKGIGRWTADIYLLMALLHADTWPRGDLALAKAVKNAMRLEFLPNDDLLEEMAAAWKPWRAVAARFFWHYYLST
jgi:DNA-3-methyladenine glycosylase II